MACQQGVVTLGWSWVHSSYWTFRAPDPLTFSASLGNIEQSRFLSFTRWLHTASHLCLYLLLSKDFQATFATAEVGAHEIPTTLEMTRLGPCLPSCSREKIALWHRLWVGDEGRALNAFSMMLTPETGNWPMLFLHALGRTSLCCWLLKWAKQGTSWPWRRAMQWWLSRNYLSGCAWNVLTVKALSSFFGQNESPVLCSFLQLCQSPGSLGVCLL